MINLVTLFIRISRFSYSNFAFVNMVNQHVNDNAAFNGASACQYFIQQQGMYNHAFGQPSVMYPSYNQHTSQASIQVNQQDYVELSTGTSFIYSAFANSCPLQTDPFHFPLIQSHNALLSSNKFY